MAIGPVQLIVIGFEPTDRRQKRIRRELQELHGRGIIRLIDTLFVHKDAQGALTRMEGSQPSDDRLEPAGQVLGTLIGLDTPDPAIRPGDVGALAFAEHNYGLSRKDIMRIADQLAPGAAAALLLIEHPWALRLKAAMRGAGGKMLAQSFLTPETLLWVGDEVQVIAETEAVIELASALKGAALLEALANVAEIKLAEDRARLDESAVVSTATAGTAAVVRAIRALIVGGLIAEDAAWEAIGVLVDARLIAEATVAEAVRRADQTAIETQAAIFAVEEVAQRPLA
ncbi:MAG TPA: hypothetical protein VFO07_09415 [Roseiflexaceae bacterium]|nr:hypothetical protein [Roseiflexaceae bacterium]